MRRDQLSDKLIFFGRMIPLQYHSHSLEHLGMFHLFHQVFHRIIYNSGRVNHCRHADGDHRSSDTFFCNGITVVADTGSRINPCIRNLDRPVQPFGISGRQRIHHKDYIRLRLCHNATDDLCGFHAGLCHYPRDKSAYQGHFILAHCILSIFPDNVPRNIQIVRHIRSQSVRRHLPVPQSHHQDRNVLILASFFPFSLQKFLHTLRNLHRDFPVIPLIRYGKIRCLHRNICSNRLSHRLCSVLCLDLHRRRPDFPFLVILLFQNDALDLHIFFFKSLFLLQSQIGPDTILLNHDKTSLFFI